MAKRGYTSKGRKSSKGFSNSGRYAAKSSSRGGKRRSSGGNTGRTRAVAPQTIRIVFAQEPGGASLANPALPIPPSITPGEKKGKARL